MAQRFRQSKNKIYTTTATAILKNGNAMGAYEIQRDGVIEHQDLCKLDIKNIILNDENASSNVKLIAGSPNVIISIPKEFVMYNEVNVNLENLKDFDLMHLFYDLVKLSNNRDELKKLAGIQEDDNNDDNN